MLTQALASSGLATRGHDDLSIQTDAAEASVLQRKVAGISQTQLEAVADAGLVRDLKFSQCLPETVAIEVLSQRLSDRRGVADVLSRPMRLIRDATTE